MIRKEIFNAPTWNDREIIRYARAKDDEITRKLISECKTEAEPILSYRVCYTILPISREEDYISFGTICTGSDTLKKATANCDSLLLFAATIGAPFDRLIARYSSIEPSKALFLQAMGAERVESLCDVFCKMIDEKLKLCKKSLRTRVSPGYGDVPLLMQRDIFQLLDCSRKIGLTLGQELLMSPSKSVTAIAGISAEKNADPENKCDSCSKNDCIYRNRG